MAQPSKPSTLPLSLSPAAIKTIQNEIKRAGGREVTFLAEVGPDRVLTNARCVARGNRSAVLAVAKDAAQGSVMLHNHPSGVMEPSDADLAVAATLFEEGLGSAIVDNEASSLYVVVEPPLPRVISPLDLDGIDT